MNGERLRQCGHIGRDRPSETVAAGMIAHSLRVPIDDLEIHDPAPASSITFSMSTEADPEVRHDADRVTVLHDWHLEHGAVFDNVAHWRCPRYYPRTGEDRNTAVFRECRAAREGVVVQDLSYLGTIDVTGPDAAEFLDRCGSTTMSTVPVGQSDYSRISTRDAVVVDNAAVLRVGTTRFLVTTTPGDAADVEECLKNRQQEYSELRVRATSVTDQWATVALAGPTSRELLRDLAPDIPLEERNCPVMSWREGDVGGVDARVCRLGTPCESTFEISVLRRHARELWEVLLAAGRPYDITPCGTEAMRVLRAEQGFPPRV